LYDFHKDQADQLNSQQQDALITLINQLHVLVLWDRFRWREALDAAQACEFDQIWPELHSWWERVEASIDWDPSLDPPISITGYELVQDLLLNAERRGCRGWYDDAVARLYRATELLAQTYIRLELQLQGAPDWSQRKLQLATGEWFDNTGVSGLYYWLQDHEAHRGKGKADKGLGSIYARQKYELKHLFSTRNQSLLGHGLQPISEVTWKSLQERVSNLLASILQELAIEQGPLPAQLPALQLLHQPFLSVLLAPSSNQQP
jgi:hypothetical protein